MADFCQQCSIEYFGKDTRDLAGLCHPDDLDKDHGITVICEGCGPTLVDLEGRCVWTGCPEHGGSEP